MKLRHITAAVTILTVAACASSSLPTDPVVYSRAEAADSIRIRVGQTVVVEGIQVRFAAVESDSRCAIDVVCIWEGDAVANFVVEQNAATAELKLHTSLQPQSGTAFGSRVELLQLAPAPRASSPIKPDAYSAWIRITTVE